MTFTYPTPTEIAEGMSAAQALTHKDVVVLVLASVAYLVWIDPAAEERIASLASTIYGSLFGEEAS